MTQFKPQPPSPLSNTLIKYIVTLNVTRVIFCVLAAALFLFGSFTLYDIHYTLTTRTLKIFTPSEAERTHTDFNQHDRTALCLG